MTGVLVLVRHGQSEWNLKNLFTGWKNPDLTEKGVKEAEKTGENLKDKNLKFDIAFTSELLRAQKTCAYILSKMQQQSLLTLSDQALNERDYGDLSGLNKDEARIKWGDEQVHIWRRSYDVAPPNGESLKDTGARVWLYYIHQIQPFVLRGNTVLVVAHGNSLRALIMAIEGLSKEEIVEEEIATGVPIIYQFRSDSTISKKEILY